VSVYPSLEPKKYAPYEIQTRKFPNPRDLCFAIILSFFLKMILPGQIFSVNWLGHIIGWPFVVIGILISLWATSAAGEINIASPNRLITTGPYAYSRNPMYVGWTLIFLGAIFIFNALCSFGLLVIVLVYTHFFVIVPEEKFLKKKFGTQFEEYQKNVRRYI
jgi:protein-S-isoprenylcysteine O-methyltransferase Ste14